MEWTWFTLVLFSIMSLAVFTSVTVAVLDFWISQDAPVAAILFGMICYPIIILLILLWLDLHKGLF